MYDETPTGQSMISAPLGASASNRQVFENRADSQRLMEEYLKSDQALHNDKPPNLVIATERPEHRMILYLKANGRTNHEIATAMGMSYGWVCQVVRQPWFKQRFVEVCKEVGTDAVKAFLSSEALPSLQTLAVIRDNAKASDSARVSAANSLLDRMFGKPTQHIESNSTHTHVQIEEEADKVKSELDKVNAELRALGVN